MILRSFQQPQPAKPHLRKQKALKATTPIPGGWFTGERLGQSVRLAELTALVFRLPGIANCTITSPAADVAVSGTQLPVLGALSVTQAQ